MALLKKLGLHFGKGNAAQRKWRMFLLITLIILAVIFLYWQSNIFNPLLLGLALAYVFNPLINWVTARFPWLSRKAAIAVLFLLLVVGITLFMVVAIPRLVREAESWHLTMVGEEWTDLNGNGLFENPDHAVYDKNTHPMIIEDGIMPAAELNWSKRLQSLRQLNPKAELLPTPVHLASIAELPDLVMRIATSDNDLKPTQDIISTIEELALERYYFAGIPVKAKNSHPEKPEEEAGIWSYFLAFISPQETEVENKEPVQIKETVAPLVPRYDSYIDKNNNGRFDPGFFFRLEEWLKEPSPMQISWLPDLASGWFEELRHELRDKLAQSAKSPSTGMLERARVVVQQVVESSVSGLGWLYQTLILAIMTPIYFAFLLDSFPDMTSAFKRYLPGRYRQRTLDILGKIDKVMGAFFRGRIIICSAIGIVTALGFSFCELRYGLLFGLLIGILSFIPFLNVLGYIPVVITAWVDGLGFWGQVALLIVYGIGQLVDPLLTTKLMGKDLELHPITILLSMFLFGSLLGFFGMLLSVPLAATAKILGQEFVMPMISALADEPEIGQPPGTSTPPGSVIPPDPEVAIDDAPALCTTESDNTDPDIVTTTRATDAISDNLE